MKVDRIKANGVHYTPPALAEFLAATVAQRISATASEIEVLDPACGNGSLLLAFSQVVHPELRKKVVLCGYERDGEALRQAGGLLAKAGVADIVLEQRDFLAIDGIDIQPRGKQMSLFDDPESTDLRLFDAVIANPPYVRTQVLGAATARELAKRFALTGRVDLYHAFTKAMANVLKPGGILGVLTSNRFLTVKSGVSLRRFLRTEFHLEAIYDLGDTKLFAAAVLPAIVVARKEQVARGPCIFDRIYVNRSSCESADAAHRCRSVLDAFADRTVKGIVRSETGTFKIERGVLSTTNEDEAWSLSTADYQEWLKRLESRRSHFFDDIACIRVGIKTTADEVFIREDWESLPRGLQPEAELLRPLLTHLEARRWTPSSPKRKVLYTHAIENGRRVAIRLQDYPRASAYLEHHKERLSRRKYVIEAGRKWHEIWVPHNPGDWGSPKIVFPDICEEPRFSFDPSGAIVNGDCYWITLRQGFKPDWLLLLLAVANSSFATRYYDIAFHNKLYSGRRRFMTQYVKQFPLPHVDGPIAQEIVRLVREQLGQTASGGAGESRIDALVWGCFGLIKETAG